ncbi:MAG: ribonuclease III [Terracidiphilus sp.]|jgi:ribonuclease-3
MEAALAELEAALGHRFSRPELLARALTHRSYANEHGADEQSANERAPSEQALKSSEREAAATGDNERLEFLGDAVLGLVVAEALFLLHPEWQEGELTRLRAQLVSRRYIAEVALALGLGSHLRLSRGEEHSGLRRKSSVLSNTMEAVLGALFLDGGLEPVRAFAGRWVLGQTAERLASELRTGAALGNHKSALQEYLQAARAGAPVYRIKSESGPDHFKRFLVEVRLKTAEDEPGKPLARGTGSTRKSAEQDAARRALERLKTAGKNVGDETGSESAASEEEQTAQ